MNLRQWLFENLFGAESRRLDTAEALTRTRANQLTQLRFELAARPPRPPPARFKLEGGLPAEQIAERLRGQEKSPVIVAIVAHLSAKIVGLADKSTDAPRGEVHLGRGEVVPAFTETERLHFSGQASGVAEVLAELQELTSAKEEEPAPSRTAVD